MSYKFIKRVSYVLIILPMILFLTYSLLGSDISGWFWERAGLIIRISLLTLSIIGSFILLYSTKINTEISQSSKKFTSIMSISWIVFILMVIYLVYAFRNCCGF